MHHRTVTLKVNMHDLDIIERKNAAIVAPALDASKATGQYLVVNKAGLGVHSTSQHEQYADASRAAKEFVKDLIGASSTVYGPDGTPTYRAF